MRGEVAKQAASVIDWQESSTVMMRSEGMIDTRSTALLLKYSTLLLDGSLLFRSISGGVKDGEVSLQHD